MVSLIGMSSQLRISRNLQRVTDRIGQALERLGTGRRLNSPRDGVVAYNQMKGLETQARGIRQAMDNVSNVQGLIQTADSALNNMLEIAYNLRELAQRAQDGSLTTAERETIQEEASQLIDEMKTYAEDAEYNSRSLLDGSLSDFTVQNSEKAGSNFSFSIGDARTLTLGRLAITSGAQTAATSTALGSGNTLTINGVAIGASLDDGVSNVSADGSALAKANAINAKSDETGVYAEVVGTIRTFDISATGTFTGDIAAGEFKINGTSITGTGIDTASELIDAINQASDTTGVVASVTSTGSIQLYAVDGRNIQVIISNGATNNLFDWLNLSQNGSTLFSGMTVSGAISVDLSAGSSKIHAGAIQLWSSEDIVISATASTTIGVMSGRIRVDSSTAVQYLNLESSAGADEALKVLDATIEQISSLRANVGAVHNRLNASSEYLVSSLNVVEEAAEAIGGTDFALETANLVMNQLLADSNIASMIQANVNRITVAKLLQDLE